MKSLRNPRILLSMGNRVRAIERWGINGSKMCCRQMCPRLGRRSGSIRQRRNCRKALTMVMTWRIGMSNNPRIAQRVALDRVGDEVSPASRRAASIPISSKVIFIIAWLALKSRTMPFFCSDTRAMNAPKSGTMPLCQTILAPSVSWLIQPMP